MTIDEAIKILDDDLCKFGSFQTWASRNAVELGIEALKAIKCGREGLRTEFDTPLIGETKD